MQNNIQGKTPTGLSYLLGEDDINIEVKASPSSTIRVASTFDEDRKTFEEQKKKGLIPIDIDFDKWLDEKEEFELGGDPDAKLKKQTLDSLLLSNALQKIDMSMSGIMETLNLAGGGKVLKFPSDLAKSKEPKVKPINLASYFKTGMTVANLSPKERDLVNDLLRRTLGKK
jgi:hypothetical protein